MTRKYKIDYRSEYEKSRQRRKKTNLVTGFSLLIIFFVVGVIFLYSKFNGNDKDIYDDKTKQSGDNSIIREINNSNKPNTSDQRPNDKEDIDNSSEDNQEEIEEEEIPKYNYSKKVPKNDNTVGNEYFDDAVFIGNSQTEGILIYSEMKNTTVYAGKGIMVDTIFTKEVVKTVDGSRITIMQGLENNKFGKVYIMLGANELGWPDQSFIKQYGVVIDKIKELQPEALIYINLIMPMAKSKSDYDKIYNNTNINRFNDMIKTMASEKEVYFIDSREAVADEEGYLPEDAGADGVHLNREYYGKWFEYLKSHTVNIIE